MAAVDEVSATITLSAGGRAIAATKTLIFAANEATGTGLDVISVATNSIIESTTYQSVNGLASIGSRMYHGVYSNGVIYEYETSDGTKTFLRTVGTGYSPNANGSPSTMAASGNMLYFRTYNSGGYVGRYDTSSANPTVTNDSTAGANFVVGNGTDNTIYYASGSAVKIVNGTTGAVTRTINTGSVYGVVGLCPTDDGRIYVFTNEYQELMLSIYSESTGAKLSGPTSLSTYGSAADFTFARRIGTKIYAGIANPYVSSMNKVRIFDTKTNTVTGMINVSGGRDMCFVGSTGYLISAAGTVSVFDTGMGVKSGFFAMF